MYELILLLEKEEDLKKVEETISQNGGKIENKEKWGERLLAYPIKKKNKAIYFIITLTMDKKNVLPFKRKLDFNEKIIRYLLLVKKEK
jgi:small subunit ribosomal protein S6